MTPSQTAHATLARRCFLRWLAASPLAVSPLACHAISTGKQDRVELDDMLNLLQFEDAAHAVMRPLAYDFLAGGADDEITMRANRSSFQTMHIRTRRLVDVSSVDTGVDVFGERLPSPVLLAPMGDQGDWHREGERSTVRAAAALGHRAIVSTLSTYSIEEIAAASPRPLWFQLYPTTDRGLTAELIGRAEAAGCTVLVLTVDTPVVGNRERQKKALARILGAVKTTGNFAGRDPFPTMIDPAMTWDMVDWLRERTRLPIVLKGIVTREDAAIAILRGVDGVIVSNHGGRQEESGRGAFDCLPEVVEGCAGRVPVLVDGGFRRGTDVFKALALGARGVCIGRPYGFALAAFGEPGVRRVLEILDAELRRIMALAGTRSLREITPAHVGPA